MLFFATKQSLHRGPLIDLENEQFTGTGDIIVSGINVLKSLDRQLMGKRKSFQFLHKL